MYSVPVNFECKPPNVMTKTHFGATLVVVLSGDEFVLLDRIVDVIVCVGDFVSVVHHI